jgi:hypothetical protein
MPLFKRRMADPSSRPAGTVPVQLLMLSHPTACPPADDAEEGPAESGPAQADPAAESAPG